MGFFLFFYQLWSRVWKLLSFSNFSYKQKWNVGSCQQLSFDQPLEWTKFLWTKCTYRICNQKRVSSSRSWEKREKHVFNVMMGQCTMKELYFLDHKGHVDCWNFDGSIQYNQRPEIIVSRLSLSPYQCIYMLCGRTVCVSYVETECWRMKQTSRWTCCDFPCKFLTVSHTLSGIVVKFWRKFRRKF